MNWIFCKVATDTCAVLQQFTVVEYYFRNGERRATSTLYSLNWCQSNVGVTICEARDVLRVTLRSSIAWSRLENLLTLLATYYSGAWCKRRAVHPVFFPLSLVG